MFLYCSYNWVLFIKFEDFEDLMTFQVTFMHKVVTGSQTF